MIAATLDPECVLYQPASLPYGGEWRGPAGFERWMKAFGQQWASLEVRDAKFYPMQDTVFSHSHVYAVARATGQAVDWPLLQLFKVRNDKLFELRPFHWDTAAMLPSMTSRFLVVASESDPPSTDTRRSTGPVMTGTSPTSPHFRHHGDLRIRDGVPASHDIQQRDENF